MARSISILLYAVALSLWAADGLLVEDLEVTSDTVGPRGVIHVRVQANTTSGREDGIKYHWHSSGGTIRIGGTPAEALWRAPARPGKYQIGVMVEEGRTSVAKAILVTVEGERKDERTLSSDQMRSIARDKSRTEAQLGIAELRAQIDKRDTYQDMLRADMARDELGFTLLEQGAHEEAAGVFEEGLSTLPFNAPKAKTYHLGLGIALYNLGREDEALESLRLADDYNIAKSYLMQGKIFEKRGKLAEAMENYRLSAEANRRNPEPVLSLARLYVAAGKSTEAARLLVDRSRFLGRKPILDGLQKEESLRSLLEEMKRGGRLDALQERSSYKVEISAPDKATRPKPPSD